MIEKRRSKIQGTGVFATQPIPKNKRIVTYDGEKISNRESLKREIRYLRKGHIWCFKLNRLYVRDAAVGGNIARFINHACLGNCRSYIDDKRVYIEARRNIQPGEEINYNYGKAHFDEFIKPKGCLCARCVEKRKAARAAKRR